MLDSVAGLLPSPTAMSLAQVQNKSNCAKTSTELFSLFKYSQGYFQMNLTVNVFTLSTLLNNVQPQKLINIKAEKHRG